MTTEVGKKRAINRLQTFYPLRALIDEMYKGAQESKKKDRPVVWAMADRIVHPILNVMDAETIYPENYATICAATGTIIPYLERSVAEGFPNYVCGYLQLTIGYAARMVNELGGEIPPDAPQGGMAKPDLLLTWTGQCTAHCKPFGVSLGRYLDTPVWATEPRASGFVGVGKEKLREGAYERDTQFEVKRYRKFIAFLERLFGKKFDWDRFREDVTQSTEMRQVMDDISELRQARPNPMHARDFFGIMSATTFGTSDYQKAKKLHQNMYDEVKYRVDNKISGINREEKYRVAFNGLGPWFAMNLFDNLAERGWNFPREGYHYSSVPLEASITDPLERLIRDSHPDPSKMIDKDFGPEEGADIKEEIRQKGYSPRLTGKEAEHFKCDGVLLWSSLGCHAGGATQFLYPINLMKAYKVPCLIVETDQCDPRLFDMNDFMRRAEAFEETMDHYKEVRKKAGMDW